MSALFGRTGLFWGRPQVCPYPRFGSRLHRLFRDRPLERRAAGPSHCKPDFASQAPPRRALPIFPMETEWLHSHRIVS